MLRVPDAYRQNITSAAGVLLFYGERQVAHFRHLVSSTESLKRLTSTAGKIGITTLLMSAIFERVVIRLGILLQHRHKLFQAGCRYRGQPGALFTT